MYTILTKIHKAPYYNNQDFIIYVNNNGYTPLDKKDAEKLLEIFKAYPAIFIDPAIVPREEEDVVLIEASDEEKYKRPLSFDANYIIEDLKKEDYEKLCTIKGMVVGIDQKYTADNI